MKIAKLPQDLQVNALERSLRSSQVVRKTPEAQTLEPIARERRKRASHCILNSLRRRPRLSSRFILRLRSIIPLCGSPKKDAAVLTEARQIVEKYLKPILVDASPYVRQSHTRLIYRRNSLGPEPTDSPVAFPPLVANATEVPIDARGSVPQEQKVIQVSSSKNSQEVVGQIVESLATLGL